MARDQPGLRVRVFEEKPGWEKPCGGGLPPKVLRRYPFLIDAVEPHCLVRDAEFVAANGDSVRLSLPQRLAVYSRNILNALLLGRAQAAGAEVVAERVLGFERIAEGWELRTRDSRYSCGHLIVAAGGRTSLRQRLAPRFGAQDFMLTFGYYLPGLHNLLRVQFFKNFEGYAWAFPRPDHLSVGIAAKESETSMAELKQRLHAFMDRFGYGPEWRAAPVFSHLLPALDRQSWRALSLAGPRWTLAGDAAGLVDPVTGEGIHFAMRSGELAAEAILDGAAETYPARVWRDFGRKLAFGARLARRFYFGTFLGEPCTTRMIQYAARSQVFRRLLEDLIDGSQSYLSLAPRVCWSFLRAAGELALGSRGAPPGMQKGSWDKALPE